MVQNNSGEFMYPIRPVESYLSSNEARNQTGGGIHSYYVQNSEIQPPLDDVSIHLANISRSYATWFRTLGRNVSQRSDILRMFNRYIENREGLLGLDTPLRRLTEADIVSLSSLGASDGNIQLCKGLWFFLFKLQKAAERIVTLLFAPVAVVAYLCRKIPLVGNIIAILPTLTILVAVVGLYLFNKIVLLGIIFEILNSRLLNRWKWFRNNVAAAAILSEDVKKLGRLYGYTNGEIYDIVSAYWDNAEYDVLFGLPLLPGVGKFRIKLFKRRGSIMESPKIPLLSLMLKFGEPPNSAVYSGFNLLPTDAWVPGQLFTEDTRAGFGEVNRIPIAPFGSPVTPAAGFGRTDYWETVKSQAIYNKSVERAAQLMKGRGLRFSMDHQHPIFDMAGSTAALFGRDGLFRNIFGMKAFEHDYVAFDAARGAKFFNYLFFAHTGGVEGLTGKQVGPFALGEAEAYWESEKWQEFNILTGDRFNQAMLAEQRLAGVNLDASADAREMADPWTIAAMALVTPLPQAAPPAPAAIGKGAFAVKVVNGARKTHLAAKVTRGELVLEDSGVGQTVQANFEKLSSAVKAENLAGFFPEGTVIRVVEGLQDVARTTAGGRVVKINRYVLENAPENVFGLLLRVSLSNEKVHVAIGRAIGAKQTLNQRFAGEVLATREELRAIINLTKNAREVIKAWLKSVDPAKTNIDEYFEFVDGFIEEGIDIDSPQALARIIDFVRSTYHEEFGAVSTITPEHINEIIKVFVRRKIERVFKPELYGYYGLLPEGRIVVREEEFGEDDIRINLVITSERAQDNDGLYKGGFECFEGAALIQHWLEEIGVKSEVCEGKTDLWDVYFYVELSDGTKFNATPGIDINGGIHKTKTVPRQEVTKRFKQRQGQVPIADGFKPIKWRQIDQHRAILTVAGIDIGLLLDRRQAQDFNLSFCYAATFVQGDKGKGELKVTAIIPKRRLLEVQRELSGVKPEEVVEKLQAIGIEVKIERAPPGKLTENEEALLEEEKNLTIDTLYYLITKVNREIVDRFTPAPEPPKPQPRTNDLQEELKRAHIGIASVLRSLSIGETANIMAPSSLRINRIAHETHKTSLVIGIPEENATPEVLQAVQNRLIDMGRIDILVIPVDKERMGEKLNKLNVPFGVILDVDNMKNIEKILEPFITELDLQGLFHDYPIPYRVSGTFSIGVSGTKLNLDRNTLIKIITDRRLLPRIASFDLEYMFGITKEVLQNKSNIPKQNKKQKAPFMDCGANLAIIVKEKGMQIRRVFKK
ncbi:MAG: hypothetical protein NC828_03290 [Candidatus Omnitrophica bacterium]|nr:hypothetical protein [Candidatus Omnitrophota bacterium]